MIYNMISIWIFFLDRFSTYLVHLKGGSDGLNQDCSTDGSTPHTNVVLGQVEDVVPEPSLKMRLHLRQVEVWARSTLDKLMGVVEEVQSEIEKTTGNRLTVNGEVLLLEVPASGTGDECG